MTVKKINGVEFEIRPLGPTELADWDRDHHVTDWAWQHATKLAKSRLTGEEYFVETHYTETLFDIAACELARVNLHVKKY